MSELILSVNRLYIKLERTQDYHHDFVIDMALRSVNDVYECYTFTEDDKNAIRSILFEYLNLEPSHTSKQSLSTIYKLLDINHGHLVEVINGLCDFFNSLDFPFVVKN